MRTGTHAGKCPAFRLLDRSPAELDERLRQCICSPLVAVVPVVPPGPAFVFFPGVRSARAGIRPAGMYWQLRGMVALYLRGEEHGGTQAGEA
jgi:hypothetical protein